MNWTCPNCSYVTAVVDMLLPFVCKCGGIIRTDGTFHIPKPIPFQDVPSVRNGQWKSLDKEYYDSAVYRAAEETMRQGRAAWESIHTFRGKTREERARFLDDWEQTIPNTGCGCSDSYEQYKRDDPPSFETDLDFFCWSVRMHNRVNQKLQRKQWSVAYAIQQWKLTQPTIDSMVAVTSLSLLPKHKEVQQECLDSWRRFGLQVVSCNTHQEVDELKTLYDVEFKVVGASSSYDRATPRIHDIMNAVTDKPILLISSDISIHGDQRFILNCVERRESIIGIRNNYHATIEDSKVEPWGIDAFLLYPDQVTTFPNLDFAIGQTMWDYWVPFHLQKANAKLRWVGEPFFFHRSHPVHWKKESTSIGREMISLHYGEEVDWEKWRRGLPFGEAVQ